MKKIIFAFAALVCCMSIHAQQITVKKGDTIVATYEVSQADNVEFTENPWINIGTGKYCDAVIAPLFSMEAIEYDVEIMEHKDKPGLYRIMNPYSNSVYPYAENDCAPEGRFIEVDAQDPEGVFILEQSLGFDWGYGEFSIVSVGGYYMPNYSIEELKENKYLGTLKDGVITFPVLTSSNGYEYSALSFLGNEGYYSGGTNWKITLPNNMQKASKETPKVLRKANLDNKAFEGTLWP